MRTQHGICGLCFHSPGCGVIVHFDENGRITRLDPDPQAPMGKVLCPIADSVEEVIYSDKRIRQPMKRVGPKGSFDFEPISWDAAYRIIAERLGAIKEQHGPEAAAFYAGTGSYERAFKDAFKLKGAEIYLATSILFPFGSPNTFGVGAPCYTSLGVLAPKVTMGCLHIDMFSDVDNSDLIVVWGTDPSTSTPPALFEQLRTAADEGAEIIVIDPRRTAAADLPGSEWLPIRPGSDGALALGLSHILIRDDLFDKAFVDDWTVGFEAFAEYVQEFPPKRVAELTGIGEDTIEDLAERIADAEGASYVMYTGLEYTKSGVQNIRAVMVLWALAGQLDVEGGRCFLGRGRSLPLATERQLATPGLECSIGAGKFPVYAHYCGGEPHAILLPRAIIDEDPYPVRGLIVLGASLLTAWPNPSLWQQALEKLEFLVSIDLQLTRDAAYADLVLPATTAFEQASYCYYGNAIRYREQMIEPVGEARPAYQIMIELAGALGYADQFPGHPDELLADHLARSDTSLADLMLADRKVFALPSTPMVYRKWEKGLLRADGQPGFETPSGKFEIKAGILEQYGYDGLPRYEESDETPLSRPDLLRRFPLILGTGPFKPDMKSCLRAIPSFIEKYPEPMVQMNPVDAEARKIKTGDLVVIKTARGQVPMRAFVTEKIMAGFVYAPVGGGGPQGPVAWQQANVNQLTDDRQYDDISGFPVYKTLLCQIKKKKRVRRGAAAADPTLGCGG
ncbi:molybdopterin-dependent oxidoreductase [Desulfosarcina ovata]|uniref:Dehydrogenase n=1 Tax=Desulfosarcina ovata subsp. ovata TaxID=2752305 RepID=A0A5K8AEH6_9BACT|nr:molybdopterin-dependent oxidoreductase [Desulfosarcina ovata]BBO90977.1 dehydrogenase [Desulfosarcina ovata subsp. ovata]